MEKSLDRPIDALRKKAPPVSPQPKRFKRVEEDDEDEKRRMNVTYNEGN